MATRPTYRDPTVELIEQTELGQPTVYRVELRCNEALGRDRNPLGVFTGWSRTPDAAINEAKDLLNEDPPDPRPDLVEVDGSYYAADDEERATEVKLPDQERFSLENLGARGLPDNLIADFRALVDAL